jgi:hypothetical protein
MITAVFVHDPVSYAPNIRAPRNLGLAAVVFVDYPILYATEIRSPGHLGVTATVSINDSQVLFLSNN